MAKSNEYLERRCAINEAVLLDLGNLLSTHFPELGRSLAQMGVAWDQAIDTLDREIPDAPPEEPKGLIMDWILASESMPQHGQLVVKYWNANGNVWAGKHIADAKHGSFDKWLPLPSPKG